MVVTSAPITEAVPLCRLRPAPWNPRLIRDRRFKQLCASLRADPDFLWERPVLAQADGTIYAGNMRYRAAEHLGWATVPARLADVPEHQAKERGLRDNNAYGEWQEDELAALLVELQQQGSALDMLGFPDEDLARLLDSVGALGDTPVPEPQLDRAEALCAEWGVARGGLWQVGRHRLLCGDATSADDLARLLDGARASMLHTDPPYGINIVSPKGLAAAGQVGGSKPFGATSGTARRSSTGFDSARPLCTVPVQSGPTSRNQIIQSNVYPVIEGDDRPFDPVHLLPLAPVVILWGANYYADKLPPSSCWICWDKREGITRNNFADCELAWCSKPGPARVFHHLWNGLHKGSQYGERRTHPTEKPVALFAEIGRMFAPEGVWLDLYAGTGAQILAAETVGAACYACEIEPLYVATTLQRLADAGLRPERADG